MPPEGSACAVAWMAIGHEHPSLAGHFPGRPLVPGVLLLDLVLQVLRQWLAPNAVVMALPAVKFARPVLPGETFLIGIELLSPRRARFVCRCAGSAAASGTLCLA